VRREAYRPDAIIESILAEDDALQIPGMSDVKRRILFALTEPAYFRMYGAAITEMSRRGWDVSVAFEKPDRRDPPPAAPPSAGGTIRLIGRTPRAASAMATPVRLAIDYTRYLEPAFSRATYLRRRVERHLHGPARVLTHVPRLPRSAVSAAIAASRAAERLIPADERVVAWLRECAVDAVVVSPLVVLGETGVRQTEIVKAARALHLPVIVGVGSWDHLTSKGLLRVVPDAVLVWNEMQLREAVTLHRVPPSRVIVTGAQPLDHWFEPVSATAVRALKEEIGAAATRTIVLIVGSSPKMAPGDSEVQFVRRWLAAIRRSADPRLRDAFVIFRPHPGNTAPWINVDLGDPGAVILPRTYPVFPLRDSDIDLFRNSLAASTAVIGINTTAMIEAAILRKPVFTVRDAAFEHSQEQTIHFGYLTQDQGGFATTATSLAEHVQQLERLIDDPARQSATDTFIERFVRPGGAHRPATTLVCDAIERVAAAPASAHDAVHRAPISEPTR
jgi:hypothetical protein